jgi:tryptophanyl-tRNA synthetase
VIDAIIAEQRPIHERAQKYLDDPSLVRNIVADGNELRTQACGTKRCCDAVRAAYGAFV